MIIKKFQAKTETEAIMLAKQELGKDAIVMNMKTIAPKGVYRFFKKTVVEITAAIDDGKQNDSKTSDLKLNDELNEILAKSTSRSVEQNTKDSYDFNQGFFPNNTQNQASMYGKEDESAIEKKLNNLQRLIESQLKEKENEPREVMEQPTNDIEEDKNLECLRLIYNQLIENEVDEKYANQLVNDFDTKGKKELSLDNILSGIYQKIVLKLGQQKTITLTEGKTKYIFFIGPTGVGKTTTIAKIASDFLIHKKAKVGLLTADTYRVAAVEQLRTYANILEIPIKVIYSLDEMEQVRSEFEGFDVILVDTAGRSHKNEQQRDDINRLMDTILAEDRDVYLVLSATTKYKDLIKITQVYKEITDYGLIFTKLDETTCLGNIFNIRMLTNAPLSYATFGQNVPDDIGVVNPQIIAKKLLGGAD